MSFRVWYFVYDETFFDQSSCQGPFKLGYINYTLEGKSDAFPSLLTKINGDMFKRNVAGKAAAASFVTEYLESYLRKFGFELQTEFLEWLSI